MVLPNFLVIGAQKAGTGWLARNLAQHPDVCLIDREIHYFNLERHYDRGIVWYEQFFSPGDGKLWVGEKTPNYLWVTPNKISSKFGNHLPNVHKNLYEALPNAKLIVVLRNPVERAISALNHYRRQGQISPLDRVDDILLGKKQHLAEMFGILSMGYYYRHIKAYFDCFDPSQLLILIFEEDIAIDPAIALKKVCNFLEIDDSFEFKDRSRQFNTFTDIRIGEALFNYFNPLPDMTSISRLNRYLRKSPLLGPPIAKARPSKATLSKLYERYTEDNEKLFDLLGRRVESWQHPSVA
jgi:hypothetical protein